MPVNLGELLLKEKMITPQQLQEAMNHRKMSGGRLGKAVVSLGFVKGEEITRLLSRQYGVPSIDLEHFEVDPAVIKLIPAETARNYRILPLSRSGAVLTIAMADPTNVFAMDEIKYMTGYNVEPVVAFEGTIEDSIERYYGPPKIDQDNARQLAELLPDTNIMTAEDSVEFTLPGMNQVQINENIGESFASVLRSLLRQDPNIILVSEIRDSETAEIAVKAALTGHLVLSTLHTNDAPSTVSRIVNMGIEPFLVGTAVNLIQAQRLVRRVCSKCKVDVTAELPNKTLLDIGFTQEQLGRFQVFKGTGCATCNGTGYKGRVGLFEVMEITEGIRDLIMVGATAVEIKKKALEEGMLTLRMSGLEKIKQGITTIEDVLRETVL